LRRGAKEQVVLVPGLWMPAVAMTFLGAQLAARGFSPRYFAYRGRKPFEANVERLARFARESAAPGRTHFVGHSLGGVLILEALRRHAGLEAASAVLIGAPVMGCYAGRRLGLASLGRWMMGDSQPLWMEREAVWRRAAPLGVIAGTMPLGLGRVLGRLPGQNDGVVCVAETAVDGMAARALVPLGHSSLIVSRRVASLAAGFLATGAFA
jgi:pimeloyl-ACP methyl ester carboxylesterase